MVFLLLFIEKVMNLYLWVDDFVVKVVIGMKDVSDLDVFVEICCCKDNF